MHYFTTKGDDDSTIYRKITEVYGNCMSVEIVHRWRKQFLEGHTDVIDEPRSGRPSEINEDTVMPLFLQEIRYL